MSMVSFQVEMQQHCDPKFTNVYVSSTFSQPSFRIVAHDNRCLSGLIYTSKSTERLSKSHLHKDMLFKLALRMYISTLSINVTHNK